MKVSTAFFDGVNPQGTPAAHAYSSKQSGELMAELKLTVFKLELLGSKPAAAPAAAATAATPANAAPLQMVESGDDLPF